MNPNLPCSQRRQTRIQQFIRKLPSRQICRYGIIELLSTIVWHCINSYLLRLRSNIPGQDFDPMPINRLEHLHAIRKSFRNPDEAKPCERKATKRASLATSSMVGLQERLKIPAEATDMTQVCEVR